MLRLTRIDGLRIDPEACTAELLHVELADVVHVDLGELQPVRAADGAVGLERVIILRDLADRTVVLTIKPPAPAPDLE